MQSVFYYVESMLSKLTDIVPLLFPPVSLNYILINLIHTICAYACIIKAFYLFFLSNSDSR